MPPAKRRSAFPPDLPKALVDEVVTAGYYPEVVLETVDIALAGGQVDAFLVHPETTFDGPTVRRHLSVLVLTPRRLVVVHVDDTSDEAADLRPVAMSTSETVALSAIRSVSLSHVVDDPARGGTGRELNLGLAWGGISRIDLEPAFCEDPECDADHGLTGAMTASDVALRISSEAEGGRAVETALVFARTLTAAVHRAEEVGRSGL